MSSQKEDSLGQEKTQPLALITVTYSPGEHIRNLYGSLAEASSQPLTLVMADNGSVDGAPEALAELDPETVEFFPTGGNLGYGSAINLAVQHLKPARDAGEINPDYFMVVNPDVVFSPDSIDEMMRVIQASGHTDVAAVGPLILEPDGSIYPSARQVPRLGAGIGHALLANIWKSNPFTRQYKDTAVMDKQREAGWLSGSCILVRWDYFDQVGGFDDGYFMYMEDVDLGDRFSRAGYRNIFTPAAEISHAQGHSANEHKEFTLRAHHNSAYKFLADRYSAWWQAPLRVVLRGGLAMRREYEIWRSRRANKNSSE